MNTESETEQPSSTSNNESVIPSTSSSTRSNSPVLVSSMKLTNGHLVGALKQVSVQIERLRDIALISPAITPMKRSESLKKAIFPVVKKGDLPDKFTSSSLPKKVEADPTRTPSPNKREVSLSKKSTSRKLSPGKVSGLTPRRSLVFNSKDDKNPASNSTKSAKESSLKDVKMDGISSESSNVKTKSCLASVPRKRQLSRKSSNVKSSTPNDKVQTVEDKSPTKKGKSLLDDVNKSVSEHEQDLDTKNSEKLPGKDDETKEIADSSSVKMGVCKIKQEDTRLNQNVSKTVKDDLVESVDKSLIESLASPKEMSYSNIEAGGSIEIKSPQEDVSVPESIDTPKSEIIAELTDTSGIDLSRKKQEPSVDFPNSPPSSEIKMKPTLTENSTDESPKKQNGINVNDSESNASLKRTLDKTEVGNSEVTPVKRGKRTTRTTPNKAASTNADEEHTSEQHMDSETSDTKPNEMKPSPAKPPKKQLKRTGPVKQGIKFGPKKIQREGGIKKMRKKRKHVFTQKRSKSKIYTTFAPMYELESMVDVAGITPRKVGSGSGQGHRSSQKQPSSTQSQSQASNGGGANGSPESNDPSEGGSQQPPGGHNSGGDGGGGESGGKKFDRRSKEPKITDLKPCKVLVHKYVIRPAPIPPPPKYVKMEDGENHTLDQSGWMEVYKYLNNKELVQCLKVCKTWYRWVMHHSLWSTIDLNNTRIKQTHLIGMVKRQPHSLNLSYSNISFRQMEWLIARLPHLKNLNMSGNSWAAISAMCSSCCPLLASMDMSWVSGVYDQCIRDLLSPPVDHRPGVDDTTSRFHNCTSLILTGCDITDKSLGCIRHNLPKIEKLGLCCCTKLTDLAIETLADVTTIKELDISKCRGLTSATFVHLKKMPNLRKVNVHACTQISEAEIVSFAHDVIGQYLHRSGLVLIDTVARKLNAKDLKVESETEMQN